MCKGPMKFCGAVDSTYCGTCGEWREKEYDYIPRAAKHPVDCEDISCQPMPVCDKCGHNHKSVRLRDIKPEASAQAIMEIFNKPGCKKCDCTVKQGK